MEENQELISPIISKSHLKQQLNTRSSVRDWM